MEFCGDQCTLDRISRETSGLPEKIVRNYTKSLLKASGDILIIYFLL